MSAPIAQAAGQAGKAVAEAAGKTASKAEVAGGGKGGKKLNKSAKRDPELFILGGVMAGAFSLVGWFFGRKPTSASSQANVSVADASMPWQTESSSGDTARQHFKYQYHPGGDPKNPPKDAPSALHSVVVPNVTLPRELHDRFNKWGKDGY